MNCEWIKANTALYVYDELADDQRHELEQHLRRCATCTLEVKDAQLFVDTMSLAARPEPTPNMVTAARMRLQEALENAEQERGWSRFTFDFAGWFHSMKFSPALALVLIMFGFAGGVFTAWRANPADGATNLAQNNSTQVVSEAGIAGIRAVTPDPNQPDKVEIKYETLQPRTATGSINDPAIQQLLLFAARSNYSSGVRMDSIGLLAENPEDQRVREALMMALRYDKNPGVRLKALDGLKEFVKQDIRVRDAVLEALMRDENPGVRSEAINLLRNSKADGSVRDALQMLSRQDQNEYIRLESKRLLSTLPEID